MKKQLSLHLAASAVIFSILACNTIMNDNLGSNTVRGSGVVVDEDRDINDVSGVQLAMSGTLHITMGNSDSLRIEAEDNLLQYIQTDVIAGRLVIETRQGIQLENSRPINYYLTVAKLDAIAISSNGNIQTDDLQSTSFSVAISSSGNATISRLIAESISVKISSSGNLEILGGRVERQTIHISSSGEYRARDLAAAEANVSLTSSGTAIIRVSDHLSGRLSSSGDVYYIGNPDINVSMTSSGKTVQMNE